MTLPRILIPVKPLATAKTRLSTSDVDRARLALAFAIDTASEAAGLASVTVVTDDDRVRDAMAAASIAVVPECGVRGLNAAIIGGAAHFGTARITVLTADLPALRAEELRDALELARGHHRAFVPDADGTGTVALSGPADDLNPLFGPDSARRHAASGAARLSGAWPGLRRDVDTPANLAEAMALGVGVHTAELMSAQANQPATGWV
ncbi:2-phospho-L-lactate guanylyltransferase [Stackebrandtia endophytica]|uniref:Phosphoenolpyruvate guanylyltransferase n=1 Tax=Stackebrandtia endophytica TaxID=1496996 RepID=A0A543B1E6_9ACTN|nr:2-phospho-L-lactate guanylyltransferase [Stackebrandtia endophytica]TQL78657.1 2-phospho-L-lactate guanylyltransferase [Stackebrandtia endophytica]